MIAGTVLVPASAAASSSVAPAHGHPIQVVGRGLPSGQVRGKSVKAANETYNWFGYELDSFADSGQSFYSVASAWTVPVATQHTPGEAEASSDWIGIGGSCLDANCSSVDSSLIQTGTEQDVDSSGRPSYYAWSEELPASEQEIPSLPVSPGDEMYASLTTTVGSDVWSLSLRDVTTGGAYSASVVYPSTYTSAEWIEEATTVVERNGNSFSALPNLSTIPFSQEAADGAPADLSSATEDLLIDQSGNVIGTPSSLDGDVFDECAWASVCALPAPPASTAPPGVSGATVAGQTLMETPATWTNTPTSFAYQWERCDTGGNGCRAVAGATARTYTLSSSDVGHTIRVEESATNAAGSGAPASSSATGVVTAAPPTLAEAKKRLRRVLGARYHRAFARRSHYTARCSRTGAESVLCHVSWRYRRSRFAGTVALTRQLQNGQQRWHARIRVRVERS